MRLYVLAAITSAALGLAGHAPPARAQEVVVSRSVEESHTINPDTVERLPAVEREVSYLTGHGTEQASYTGALLWSVLDSAGVLAGDPRARLQRTVAVTGRDGYVAVLALAEIDPEFEGKQVLLAYRRNNQPFSNNELRLVVPGDRRGGRSVHDVVRIELR